MENDKKTERGDGEKEKTSVHLKNISLIVEIKIIVLQIS